MSAKTFSGFAIVEVEAETNTPCGGDGGHGGETLIRITCELGDFNIDFREDFRSVAILAKGDDECDQLISAFRWIAEVLEIQQALNRKVTE